MKNKIIFLMLLILLVLFSSNIVTAKDKIVTISSDDLITDGYNVSVQVPKDTKLKKDDFDWVIIKDNETLKTKSFHPKLKIPIELTEVHYLTDVLETDRNCTIYNQYYTSCFYNTLNFSVFRDKNTITSETTSIIYEDCDEAICDVESWLISFYGNITDLDPELDLIYGSTSSGFYNQTEATTEGIKLKEGNISGDYKYFVYRNITDSVPWNITLDHNATEGSTISLQTKTGDSYNLSDESLVALWSFDDDSATTSYDETGNFNGTRNNGIPDATDGNGTIGKGYYFSGSNNHFLNYSNVVGISNVTEFSISFWMNQPVINQLDIIYESYSDTNNVIRIITHTNTFFYFYVNDGANRFSYFNSSRYITGGKWHHIVYTFNGSATDSTYEKNSAYVDGELVPWISNTMTSDRTPFILNETKIGIFFDKSKYEWKGSLDNFRLYNKSLSAVDAKNLYEMENYEVEWGGDWKDEGITTSGVPKTTTGAGNFMKFKAKLDKNIIMPYLFNHEVIFLAPIIANISNVSTEGKKIFQLWNKTTYAVLSWADHNGNWWFKKDVKVDGNLNVTGIFKGNQIYAGMWYHNHTGTELNFAVDSFYYTLFMTNSTHINGFTFNGGFLEGSNLTVGSSGLYQAVYLAIGDGQNNHIYRTSVFINEENQDNCENHHKMATGGDVITQSGNCFIRLKTGDQVTIRTADFGGIGTGNYYGANLNLLRVGD